MDEPLRPAAARRRRAHELGGRLLGGFATRAAGLLGDRDADTLLARVERRWIDVYEPLEDLYGGDHDLEELLAGLLDQVAAIAAARPRPLRRLDHRREIAADWYLREDALGYVCYVDRFAGTLRGMLDRLDYLTELGVTYLHLMPLLASRPDPNDGGYAVADYRRVEPRLGTMDDLASLADALRERGISLCTDLVVNHTAREHVWARKAAAGDPAYRGFYRFFADRTLPDAYEETLPDIFPDTAPGSFTWDEEAGAWVWSTFHDYQWDLNYENPQVLRAMVDVMGFLANRGVEVLRLDAVPFIWKRLGTDCQNQPEVHALLQAFRGLLGMAAPAVVFKAEAIVEPGQLVRYLGAHDRHRPECELAYHNQLMVMSWSSLAARDARLATQALGRMRATPPTTSWVTYVRCHDDIGWAVTDEDAAAVGLDGRAHRTFLNDFYAGDFPLSFARGARFQHDPASGDARISGSAASLCGIEAALDAGDEELLEQGIRRLLLLYGIAMSYGGVPLVFMGDELALRNDHSFAEDARKARDNRWLHRPVMDWQAARRRHEPGTLEARVFAPLRRLAAVRASLPQLRGGGTTVPWHTDNPAVFAYLREQPRTGRLLALANVADTAQGCDAGLLDAAGLGEAVDALAPDAPLAVDGRVPLPRLGLRWIAED